MEEDIKVLEEFIDEFRKDNVIVSIKGIRREKEYQAIENLIARNKELECKLNYIEAQNKLLANQLSEEIQYGNKVTLELKGDNLPDILTRDYIPKSKARELIEKYKGFGWHNKDDEYWANRILDGFEELLQEGDK